MSKKEYNMQTVETILSGFKNNLYGINYYYYKIGNLALGVDIDEIKRSSEYLEDCLKEIKKLNAKGTKTENAENVIPENKAIELFRKLKKKPKISAKNHEILSKSSFLMLNNYFEYLLSDLLSYHYNKFQKSLNEKKFNLALKEINEYETIEEFTRALIIKEVESMMVEMTFDELLGHFHLTLEIDNEKEIVNWDRIRECRERRHLIVHNSSIVNKKYILRSKNPYNLKIGDIVTVDKEYFYESSKEFFLAGLLLSYNAWGKWDKEEATAAVKQIMVDSFEILKQQDYDLVSKFTTYAKKIEGKNEAQENYLLRTKVNRLIALKKLKENTSLINELKKIKVGTASPIFKLAFAILSDKHDNLLELVKQAKSIGELDLNSYKEWPIYDFIRENGDINSKIETELKITDANNSFLKVERKQVKKP